jgi:enamine deaminase RidA (YjgF/YER057c/UK114 family)
MTTERINVFDEMYKERDYTWTDLVKKGKIITISGCVATDENHRTLYKGDLMAQTRYIYETVEKLLAKVGATFDDVIKTTDYITPQAVKDYGETAEIRREFFKGNYSAATGVIVHSLLAPNWLIEIEFLAVLD